MAKEFEPKNIGNKNCDGPVVGTPHPNFDYIHRSTTGDDDYPEDACARYLQVNGRFDNLQVTSTVTASNFVGNINVQSWKGFDIKHPNKSNHRLRHICLEGPEAGIYYRGRLTNSNVIELPDYWTGLIDPETITVSLTQIGYSQDLIIEKVEWGKKIVVKSGTGANIDCYYTIQAARIDGEPLIVEYAGETPADYPGDPTQYSISGHDYGRKV
jgi:hypothetical protein